MQRLFLPKDPFFRTVLALVLGIFCGLLLGELMAPLKTLGLAYIRLLQMTVLPYIVAAVIAGIGRLDANSAGTFGLRALGVIGCLWLVAWATSLTIPLAYPVWDAGSFFSGPPPAYTSTGLMDLFIPANIFESLSNSVIPAVVVFSIALGLALMGMREKRILLSGLEVVEKAMGRIMSFIVKFAPLGVFAMAGSAAGTIQVEELSRLQIYLWTYLAACVALGCVTLPMLVAMATPISYWDVMRHARTAMLTAFAVGTVLVVVPLIAEESKKLLKKSGLASPETDSAVDVLAPTAFAFPTAATAVSLAFILFAAWFVGQPLGLDQYPVFATLGFVSSFGGMVLTLPFLLDFFRIPADMFSLFILGGVVTNNLFTAVAAMHGVVICLLAACAVVGRLRWASLASVGVVCVLLSAALFWAMGLAFKGVLPEENIGEQHLLSMQLTEQPVAVSEFTEIPPLTTDARQRERLEVIRERGSLRVGLLPDRLPYVFRNARNEVVGLEMDLMHSLAGDLEVSLEIANVEWGHGIDWLNSGRVDLVIGGVAITPERALNIVFTQPYLDETPGFLVRDENRRDFQSLQSVRQFPSLKLGTLPDYFDDQLQSKLPEAEFVVIKSPRLFLSGEAAGIDAMVFPAEMGSAWTLMYPGFTAIVPEGMDVLVPVGLGVPSGQHEFLSYLNN